MSDFIKKLRQERSAQIERLEVRADAAPDAGVSATPPFH